MVALQQADFAQAAQRRRDQFGELEVVLQRRPPPGPPARTARWTSGRPRRSPSRDRPCPRTGLQNAQSPSNTPPPAVQRSASFQTWITLWPRVHGLPDQLGAGLKRTLRRLPAVPVQHPHRGRAAVALDGHQRGRDAVGNPAQQDVGQPHPQLLVAGRPGNDLRDAAQHVDPLIGVAKAELFQLIGAERLLRHRLRQVQRKSGCPLSASVNVVSPITKCSPGSIVNRSRSLPRTKIGFRAARRRRTSKPVVPPADFDVLTGNAFVPRAPTRNPHSRPNTYVWSGASFRRQRCSGAEPWAMRSGMVGRIGDR